MRRAGRWLPFGVPDRLLLGHDARGDAVSLFVEVKRPGERPRPSQVGMITTMRDHGAHAVVADQRELRPGVRLGVVVGVRAIGDLVGPGEIEADGMLVMGLVGLGLGMFGLLKTAIEMTMAAMTTSGMIRSVRC